MRFGDTGTIPNFFKGLLSETYIPLIGTWKESQDVVADRLYIYNGNRVIRALQTSGGRYASPQNILDTWRDSSGATHRWFEVVDMYVPEKYIRGVTRKYKSISRSWTRRDHYWLGQYCRNYRDNTGIDIMPAYNCWDGGEMENAGLYTEDSDSSGGVSVFCSDKRNGLRTLTVPIRPYQNYTVLLECPTEVLMSVALTHNGLFLTDPITVNDGTNRNRTFGQGYRFMRMSIYDPIKITIDQTIINDSNIALNLIEYLTLLIQVPETTTRIYVMEGDFATQVKEYAYGAGVASEDKKDSKLTISANNMLIPYLACPDRLVEYLAEHPITWGQFDESIAKVQEIITSPEFKKASVDGVIYQKDYKRGQWDNDIRRFIKWVFDKPFNGNAPIKEQMGDVVKEIERCLWEVKNV